MFKTRRSLWWSAAGLTAVVAIVAFFARLLGWYGAYWFTDVILHTISGVTLAFFWLALTYKEKYASKFTFFLTLAMAGAFGSYFWEVYEYIGIYFVPEAAAFYVPELGDSLGDIGCGILGALAVALIYWPKARNR
jgi:hypothetical protein